MRRLIMPVLIVLLCSTALPTAAQVNIPAHDDAAASRVLAITNQWRIEQGLPPLRANADLQAMALAQVEYLYPRLDNLQTHDDYHKDLGGRKPPQRALQFYNWATYGTPERIEIGENAAEFPPDRAVQYWQNSPIHAKALGNPTYREVGVGALPLRGGSYLFIMIFGARPNVFPPLLSPDGKTLYLSRESSRYESLPQTWSVTLLNEAGQPLSGSQTWSPRLAVPAEAGARFFVEYSSKQGGSLRFEVNRAFDVAVLPESNISIAAQLAKPPAEPIKAAVQPTATHTPTVQPSATPILIITNTPRTQAALPTNTPRMAGFPTNTPRAPRAAENALSPTATHTAQPTQAPSATPQNTAADLLLVYNGRTFFVVNSSGRALDLTPLRFGRLTPELWLRVAQFPLGAFPSGHCLQANIGGAENAPAPEGCRFVRSQITVSVAQPFWAQADFEVFYNDQAIQRCTVSSGVCAIRLP
ncbi:MAG: hypothetical protein DYG88_07180 [Chloroflexi bacterium CFX4]|nr:hypothetical protein [Chloroflexi bacterium CFX4]MDL1922005.1 hypothetical protein [Chloroflexi bacterium CFX3]